MHNYLKEYIVCPCCKHPLEWHVSLKDDVHIIEAVINCTACKREYFIKDRCACFLPDYDVNQDNWQKGDSFLTRYFLDKPDAKYRLMNTPPEYLNAADMYALSSLLKEQGEEAESLRIEKLGYEKAYTKGSRQAMQSQLDYVVSQFVNTDGFVVDIASGTGRLVDQLLKETNIDIVATDISYYIMNKSQSQISADSINRISYIAFDANFIPFKNNSINNLTTFVGLQNIQKPHEMLNELKRICKNSFYSICAFCPSDDLANRAVLKKWGIEKLWIKYSLLDELKSYGWEIDCINSIATEAKPTPIGEIVEGYGIDGFPVANTNFEYCTLKLF